MKIISDSNIYNKYKIISLLGTGGFSEVYKVEMINDKSNVKTQYALKYMVFNNNMDKERTLNRFKQEVNIIKKVNSRQFPKYIDSYFGPKECYLVMEYVEGENLRDLIKRNGRIIPKEAVYYFRQICEAVHELHINKIIHRDIKSNNIIITKQKEIKILDFGLSLAPDSQRFTQDSKIIGSVYYMAPELCKTNNVPTARSDIYALGILLFELLTGKYPFAGERAPETLKKQRSMPMPRLTSFITTTQALENVIIKATAKDPYKRYQSVWDMREDLKDVFDAKKIYAKPLNAKKIKVKKRFSDVINSKGFLIGIIVSLSVIIAIALILIFTLL